MLPIFAVVVPPNEEGGPLGTTLEKRFALLSKFATRKTIVVCAPELLGDFGGLVARLFSARVFSCEALAELTSTEAVHACDFVEEKITNRIGFAIVLADIRIAQQIACLFAARAQRECAEVQTSGKTRMYII